MPGTGPEPAPPTSKSVRQKLFVEWQMMVEIVAQMRCGCRGGVKAINNALGAVVPQGLDPRGGAGGAMPFADLLPILRGLVAPVERRLDMGQADLFPQGCDNAAGIDRTEAASTTGGVSPRATRA